MKVNSNLGVFGLITLGAALGATIASAIVTKKMATKIYNDKMDQRVKSLADNAVDARIAETIRKGVREEVNKIDFEKKVDECVSDVKKEAEDQIKKIKDEYDKDVDRIAYAVRSGVRDVAQTRFNEIIGQTVTSAVAKVVK